MDIILTLTECRILGSLVEKEMTTPDYYPLSLNGLLNACNQKSNRQPVLTLGEDEIVEALDRLRHSGLAMQSREGGRVAKFCHTIREKLHLDEMELAILAELLLRGAQTLGELRSRADRMAKIDSLETTETALCELIDRDFPLAVKLPRQAGHKECRYMHLMSGSPEPVNETNSTSELSSFYGNTDKEKANDLKEEIASLRQELSELREEFEVFKEQFN